MLILKISQYKINFANFNFIILPETCKCLYCNHVSRAYSEYTSIEIRICDTAGQVTFNRKY